jgi:NhaD family Na+/H+ antiporter
MYTFIIAVFVIGYLAIALEHPIKINKTATALLTGVLCWTIYVLFSSENSEHIVEELSGHLGEVSEILFFLLGAMTIVELVDAHHGFKVITDRITTRSSLKLLWILSLITFVLSAILDNLTTSIVMVSLLRKLLKDPEKRRFYAGVIIIAANAGGAFSPLGDVTTTMLWIGGQITAANVIQQLFIPSLICLLVPLIYLSFRMKGQLPPPPALAVEETTHEKNKLMLFVGVGALVNVPIFKTVTHLPPYMGMLLGLGIVWIVSEIINSNKDEEERAPYTPAHALAKIDTSSVLFFLGILIAIGALEATHLLESLATWMSNTIGNLDVIVIAIGLASAIIDNVPLVAATMGMYDITVYPTDAKLWEFLAYCAGTGGSVLIIGSAAGVAVMGMEKIDFMWYIKRISFLALIGYFAGAFAYLGIYSLTH